MVGLVKAFLIASVDVNELIVNSKLLYRDTVI